MKPLMTIFRSNLKLLFSRIRQLFVSLILLAFINPSFAAAPVTHVVLAEHWIQHQEQYSDEQKRSFMLGTLFPDIRYLGVISRSKTHERGLTLQHLLEKQSEFNKGKRLHAFVDKQRENLVVKWKIYDRIRKVPGQKYKTTFLKLLEDEILFSTRDWSDIRQYLKTIHPEEQTYQIRDEDISRWHAQLSRAFLAPPSIYLMTLAFLNRGYGNVPPEIIKEWSQLLPELAKDKEIQNYVHALLTELDKQFSGTLPPPH